MQTVEQWLRAQGGVGHTQTARAAGLSKHQVALAVESGQVRRVRRSWLVHRAMCPPELVTAASLGGRLTCASAAAAGGLWVPAAPERAHVAVARGASHVEGDAAQLHWANGPVPVGRTQPHEPLLNVLFHVARCLPRADALAVWESALRTGATDAAVLARVQWHSTRAAELAGIASHLSDSGLETLLVELLRPLGITVRQQVWVDGHPLDGLIGERLAIQLDGFAHHQARDRRRDLRADARLALRGYTTLRFDYQQVLFDPQYVVDTITTAIAQGCHLVR